MPWHGSTHFPLQAAAAYELAPFSLPVSMQGPRPYKKARTRCARMLSRLSIALLKVQRTSQHSCSLYHFAAWVRKYHEDA